MTEKQIAYLLRGQRSPDSSKDPVLVRERIQPDYKNVRPVCAILKLKFVKSSFPYDGADPILSTETLKHSTGRE